MKRGVVLLATAVALTSGCTSGDGTEAGLQSALATIAPTSTLTFEQVQRVCSMSGDDLVDAAQLLAKPGLEDAERAMQAGLDYACPDKGKDYAGVVARYREAMGY